MHELKITGETPDQLYFNVINTLSLFLRGPAQTTTAPVSSSEEITLPASETKDLAAETASEEITLRGATQADAKADKIVEPDGTVVKERTGKKTKAKVEKMPVDEVGDLGVKTIENEPKVLTLDGDIRPRLQAIQAACTRRGLDMASCVSYIQKLYGPFGIANAKQLRPEQFSEFMEASDGYLSGEA